eukprot:jgi/Chlat1/213/Chrsp1S00212
MTSLACSMGATLAQEGGQAQSSSSAQLAYCDVYGLDDELLAMVPSPAAAVLLLFPITPQSEAASREETERIRNNKQQVSEKVWFTRQTVGNACGTIGLIHSLANQPRDKIAFEPGSYFDGYFRKTQSMTPEERAQYLETDHSIEEAHAAAASTGDSAVPDADAPVDLHFVCFVCIDGSLYELDGRKPHPVNHGPSSPETLLKDAAKVIRQFMDRSPESSNFNVIALAPAVADY